MIIIRDYWYKEKFTLPQTYSKFAHTEIMDICILRKYDIQRNIKLDTSRYTWFIWAVHIYTPVSVSASLNLKHFDYSTRKWAWRGYGALAFISSWYLQSLHGGQKHSTQTKYNQVTERYIKLCAR